VTGVTVGTGVVVMFEMIVVVGTAVGVVIFGGSDVVVSGAGVVVHFSTSS